MRDARLLSVVLGESVTTIYQNDELTQTDERKSNGSKGENWHDYDVSKWVSCPCDSAHKPDLIDM